MKLNPLWLALLAGFCSRDATPDIEVALAHGTEAEAQTRDQLQRLRKTYDLSSWTWTRKVLIEQDAIPHSHPVVALHTRHLKDDLALLSTFVHEEYHWYETAHPQETAAALAELTTAYPHILGGQGGASDEESSYLDIIVCYGEYKELKALVGAERALKVMQFWTTDHYRAIYKLVLDHEAGSDLFLSDTVYSRLFEPPSTGYSVFRNWPPRPNAPRETHPNPRWRLPISPRQEAVQQPGAPLEILKQPDIAFNIQSRG